MPADKKQQSEIKKAIESAVNNALKKSVGSTKIELDISGYEDQVDYSDQLLKLQESLNERLSDSTRLQRESRDITKELSREIKLESLYLKQGMAASAAAAQQRIKSLYILENQTKEAVKQAQLNAEAIKDTLEKVSLESQLTTSQREANKLLETKSKINDEISKLEDEIKNTTGENQDIVKSILRGKLEQIKNLKEVNDLELENLKLAGQLGISKEELIKLEEKYQGMAEASLGYIDSMKSSVEKIPILGEAISDSINFDKIKTDGLKKITSSMATASQSGAGTMGMMGSMVSGMAGSFSAILSSIGAMLVALGPILLIIGAIVAAGYLLKKIFIDTRDAAIDTARAQGLNTEEAAKFNNNITLAANNATKLGANLANMKAEITELNQVFTDAFQTNHALSEDSMIAGAYLMKNMNLTAEQANSFLQATALTGDDMKTNILSLQNQVELYNDELNLGLRINDVVKAIGGASESTLANFKNQTTALLKAYAVSRKFAVSLEKINEIAEGTLDIETSLQNEMAANILTGKRINLNEARQLALVGKTDEAVSSMLSQVGSYNELLDMAPYQQEAMAKAVNMTRDELLKATKQQEVLQSLAGVTMRDIDKLSDDQIAAAHGAAKSLSDSQKEAILSERASQKASEMAGNAMAKISLFIDRIAEGGFMSMMFGDDELKNNMNNAGLRSSADIDSERMENASKPNVEPAGDMYSTAGKTVVSTKEGGLFSLSNNDEFMAAPGISSLFGSSSDGESAQLLRKNNELLTELIAKIDQPVHINIGNRAVTELEKQTSMTRRFKTSMEQGYGLHG